MKRWILVGLIIAISTMLIVNCARPVPQPPAPPTTPTAVGGIGQAVLNWNQVPGADGYQVRFQVVGSHARGWSQEVNVPAPPYTVEQEAGIYSWQVRAKKGNLYSEWVNGPNFTIQDDPGPSDLTLTLQEAPAREIPTIYVVETSEPYDTSARGFTPTYTNINYLLGQVTSTVPGLETVAYYVQEVGSQVQKRWPDSATTYQLDVDGKHQFGINDLGANFEADRGIDYGNLKPGTYWFWVQGTGDKENVRSQKKQFHIEPIENGAIEIVKAVNGKVFPGKICAPEDTSIEVDYTVQFAFAEVDCNEWMIRFTYNLCSDPDQILTETATGLDTPPEAWEHAVLYAVECTKYATVTLEATITAYRWEEGAQVEEELPVQIQGGTHFVFDNQRPRVDFDIRSIEVLDTEGNLFGYEDSFWSTPKLAHATITFHATDTKCLWDEQNERVKVRFIVMAIKSEYDATLFFNSAETEEAFMELIESHQWFGSFWIDEGGTVLGPGDWNNSIVVEATYEGTPTSVDGAPAEIVGQLSFAFGDLDGAMVFWWIEVFDCCCEDCDVEDPCNPFDPWDHSNEVFAIWLIDNAFFSAMLEEGGPMWEEFKPLDWEGFRVGPQGLPMLPGNDSGESGAITFQFADQVFASILDEDFGTWWPWDADDLIDYIYQDWRSIGQHFMALQLEGDFDGDNGNPEDYFSMIITEATKTTKYATCSGWDEKAVLIFTIAAAALETAPPTEVKVTITATATDWLSWEPPIGPPPSDSRGGESHSRDWPFIGSGNEFTTQFHFWLDTKPPTLTYFRAFRNPDIDLSKIEFRFHEEPKDLGLILAIVDGSGGAIVDQFPLSLETLEKIGSDDEFMYRLYPDVTIQQGLWYRLIATATDEAGNTGMTSLEHQAAASSVR